MIGSAQTLLNAMDGICYLADAEGRILAVGEPSWTAFLRASSAPAWGEGRVIGRNLFEAMASAEVRAIYRDIHEAVLTGSRPHVCFELRCDAPDVRRMLRMSISAVGDAGGPRAVLYQSQLLSAVTRPWMSLFDPARIVELVRAEAGLPIVTVCSFCQRAASPADDGVEWLDAEDYYRLGGASDVRVSHGACPDCRGRVEWPGGSGPEGEPRTSPPACEGAPLVAAE